MRFTALPASIAFAFLATAAHAQGWYADFGAGRATANGHGVPVETTFDALEGIVTSFGFSPMSGSDTMYTARVGSRLLPYLAVEAAYTHLGDYPLQAAISPAGPTTFTARARSAGAAVVGIVPLAPVDLYARLGIARTQVKAETGADGAAIHVDDRFNEAYYGAGVRWNATPELGLFAEYQKHDKLDLDGYVVGMRWRF